MERTPFPRRPWAQAAIDHFDLESAIPIARMAVECGVDWLEVGSPLIYAEGFDAIGALKEIAGARSVIVDYKARDNCHALFCEAQKRGADFATVTAAGNDFGVVEALRARAACGIGVLADLYGLELDDIPVRAMELAAMGVDGICIHFGNDQARYDRVRQQYDGMREAKRAASGTPISCSADALPDAIEACKQGADWVFFGADLLSSAEPERYAPLRDYVETVHAFRSPAAGVGTR
jgi:3-hexulose-6-phosphate synthase/6-phospho-3-hexuloisomerase